MKIKTVALILLFTFVAQNACADIFTGIIGAVAAPLVGGVTQKKSKEDSHDFHPLVSTAVAAVGVAAIGVTIECAKPENKYDERCLTVDELNGGEARDLVYDKAATKLKKNLNDAGEPTPDGCAAHHIVAITDKRAVDSRSILNKCNIDINDAINGVFLPQKPVFECKGSTHTNLHTSPYHEFVSSLLNTASQFGCDDVKRELSNVKRLLQDDNKIW